MRTKVLLLLAVCMAVVVGSEIPGASREAGSEPGDREIRTVASEVGASISHPDEWIVERERITYDDTRGYTLWRPEPAQKDAHAHGGTPAVRVALAYELEPSKIGERIKQKMAETPELPLKRQTVRVGEKRLEGTAVGPLPGSTPSWEVYVAVDGRVYQVNVYGEEIGREGKELLSSIRFDPPARSASSLRRLKALPDAEDPETFRPSAAVGGPSAAEKEARGKAADAVRSAGAAEREARQKAADAARSAGALDVSDSRSAEATGPAASAPVFADYRMAEASEETSPRTATAKFTASTTPVYAEYRIAQGCWRADSRFYFQTQHGWGANARANDDYPDNLKVNIPTGYTVVGRPNFWGQYTHGSLGYGRCASTYYTNDMYDVDYPLNRGDYVFSPFQKGVVTFVGSNTSHKDYGIFVVIRSSNGKYVSMSAHLSALNANVRKGTTVYANTVIGYAGNTSYGSVNPGYTHLHQAFYRYPGFTADGSPYGGQGLQAIYHHFTGRPNVRPGGVHQFGSSATSTQRSKGSLISN